MQALEAVHAVEAVESYLKAQQFFTYYTVNDEAVCNQCDQYDEGSMTRREIEGTFQYLIKYSPTMWLPMVHPNCRCVLIFEETDEMPRPNKLTTDSLIVKVEQELINKNLDKVNPELSRDKQFQQLKQNIENSVDLSPDEYSTFDTLGDTAIIAIWLLLQNKKKKQKD
jgi:hypothetical protein